MQHMLALAAVRGVGPLHCLIRLDMFHVMKPDLSNMSEKQAMAWRIRISYPYHRFVFFIVESQ